MSRVYIFLADGFEEIEGLTVADILRRGGVETELVSVTGQKTVTGSHHIQVIADTLLADIKADADMYVLPGGMPGTLHLKENKVLGELLLQADAAEKRIAAICAAPQVLGALGLLQGKTAVCYPGVEGLLDGAQIGDQDVEVSGRITTSRGMGTAIPFALSLLEQLTDAENAEKIRKSIIFSC